MGEYALAIGNAFGLTEKVTLGIISAVGRANVGISDYEDFIQADAPINPGNSWGALVNIRGGPLRREDRPIGLEVALDETGPPATGSLFKSGIGSESDISPLFIVVAGRCVFISGLDSEGGFHRLPFNFKETAGLHGQHILIPMTDPFQAGKEFIGPTITRAGASEPIS